MKKLLLIIAGMVLAVHAEAINIKVRILSESNVKTVRFNVVAGQYMLLCDNAKAITDDLKAGESVSLSFFDGKVRVERGIELLGTYSQVDLIGTRYSNVFSLQSPQAGKKRTYEVRLSVTVHRDQLIFINRLDL